MYQWLRAIAIEEDNHEYPQLVRDQVSNIWISLACRTFVSELLKVQWNRKRRMRVSINVCKDCS